MEVATFRKQPKVTIQANIPVKLAEKIGHLSASNRRPDNETLSSLLCVALGHDPAEFGIGTAPSSVSAN